MTIASKGTLGTSVNTGNNQSSFSHATATTTLSPGNLGVIIIATENNQTTDGDEVCVSNVQDSAGNTWLKAGEFTNGQGSAQAGALVSVWYTVAVNSLAPTGTITGNFTNAASHDESAFSAWAFTCNGVISLDGTPATQPSDGVDVGSLNLTTDNGPRLRIRAISEEANDGTQMTATDGTWTLFGNDRSAAIANAQCVRGEWKISTGTGDASNPTLAVTTGDSASIYIAFTDLTNHVGEEQPAGAGSLSGYARQIHTERANLDGVGSFSADATITSAGGTAHVGEARFNGEGAINPVPVVSLLHFDGADASTTIIDERGIIWGRFGNAQLDNAQSKFGGTALLLDGTGDYLLGDGGTAFAFGTGDFTIDFWIRFNNISNGTFQNIYEGRLASDPSGPYVSIVLEGTGSGVGRILFSVGSDGIPSPTSIITTGSWFHIAAVRASGVLKLFINGTQDGGEDTNSIDVQISANRPVLGAWDNLASNFVNGWIDEFRILKGQAAWTSDFTPPASGHYRSTSLLHFEGATGSTVIADEAGHINWTPLGAGALSTAQKKFGSASYLSAASGDRLSGDSSPVFNFGTGDFTVDFWVRPTALGGTQTLCDGLGFKLSLQDTEIRFFSSGTGTKGGAVPFVNDTWSHVAVTRLAGTSRLFVDGVLIDSFADTGDYQVFGPFLCGRSDGSGEPFLGYMDEFHVSNSAIWTAAFTPPASPYSVSSTGFNVTQNDAAQENLGGIGSFSAFATVTSGAAASRAIVSWLQVRYAEATGAVARLGYATFQGTGSLRVLATLQARIEATFAGTGALSVYAGQRHAAYATFGGAGSLSVDAQNSKQAEARFAGAGALSVNITARLAIQATFGGVGSLSVEATISGAATQHSGNATFNGAGNFSANVLQRHVEGVRFAGSGNYSVNVTQIHVEGARFNGTGSLSVQATQVAQNVQQAEARFNGAGNLSVNVVQQHAIQATFAGTGNLSIQALKAGQQIGEATFAGAGAFRVNVLQVHSVGAIFNGAGNFSADTQQQTTYKQGEATFQGAGNFRVNVTAKYAAEVRFTGTGTLLCSVRQGDAARVQCDGSGGMSVNATVRQAIQARFNGAGSFAPNSFVLAFGSSLAEATFNGRGGMFANVTVIGPRHVQSTRPVITGAVRDNSAQGGRNNVPRGTRRNAA